MTARLTGGSSTFEGRRAETLGEVARERVAERCVLRSVQMDAVDRARGGHRVRVEELAALLVCDPLVRFRESGTLRFCAVELRRDRTFRGADRRGHDSSTGGIGMPGSSGARRIARDGGEPLRRMPGVRSWCIDWKSLVPSMTITSASAG
jgi:hypothetical protein